MRQYGYQDADIHEYELDHLVPLALAGAPDDPANLWPQPHRGTSWTAADKDALEARLHRLVCDHKVSLQEAQQAMQRNWIEAYDRYMSKRARHKRP